MMPGDACVVCGNARVKTPQLNLLQFHLAHLPPPLTESPLTAFAGEQLEVNCQLLELPGDITDNTAEETTPWPSVYTYFRGSKLG